MRLLIFLLAALMVVTFGACGDDDEEGGTTTSPAGGATSPSGGTEVNVELVDFSVVADSSAPAGEVTFNITNSGPEHIHEFVVIRTDLDAAELPGADDGSVDEAAEGLEVIGEVEEIKVGGSETLTVDVDAGHYALICNIVDEHMGETFLHYERGMHRDFTAE